MIIDNKQIIVSGKVIKTVRIAEEWYEDLQDPVAFLKELKTKVKADLFTFWQRLPENQPKYDYHLEWESIAVLPITDYDYWWNKQISAKTRNVIRKALKSGVVVKSIEYDDDFVRGLVEIFNESPVRQGKPFWHYGKDFACIKKEFSRNLHREEIIGAYFNNKLIGFIMLADAGKYAMTTQILSMIRHRDKSPTNALLAKAVEICASRHIPYLVYAMWTTGSLGDFKLHNGFEKIDLPRYFIPLTTRGLIAIKLNLHRGIKNAVPNNIKTGLAKMRKKWYMKSKDKVNGG